jgi:diguanylate cyclase (GGDEF)-like protein
VQEASEADQGARRPWRERRGFWATVALAVAIVGVVGTVIGSTAMTQANNIRQQQHLAASSMAMASMLGLTIQHEEDLAISARAFFKGNPDASQAEFSQWMTAVRAFERYPELQAIAVTDIVPASQLGAFLVRTGTVMSNSPGAAPSADIVPPGNRPSYCLRAMSEARAGAPVVPPSVDLCQEPVGWVLLSARNTGQGVVIPFGSGVDRGLGIGSAVYRGDVLPTTVAGRQAAFIGWVGEQIDPRRVLDAALVGNPHTSVALRFGTGPSAVAFTAGVAPHGGQASTIVLEDGWSVRITFPPVSGSGYFGGFRGPALIGGVVLSLLFGALIYLLGTGRSRALQLVRASTAQLRHEVLHDPLTGLPNRVLILDRISQVMARSRRSGTPMAALSVDIDDFKEINDTLGHGAGDQLLIEVGSRLSGTMRAGDTVGRLGGDEFVVLVDGPTTAEPVGVVAGRILDALASPFEIDGSAGAQWVTVSIGIAEGVRSTPEELLRDADIALYEAKATGKQHAAVFSRSMQETIDDRRTLEVDLRGALEAGQFFVRFRPTTDLATRKVTGVEALLAWLHPERGVVPPDSFLPVLESTGLGGPVGRWLLRTTCDQGAVWNRQGRMLWMSVNVSAEHFSQATFVDDVDDALADSGFDPGHLIIALAETVLVSGGRTTMARLVALRELGVRIALGECDTGLSFFTFLQRYPIDILKVDRCLMAGTADPGDADEMAETLTKLGRVFSMDIFIEGDHAEGGWATSTSAPYGAGDHGASADGPVAATSLQ